MNILREILVDFNLKITLLLEINLKMAKKAVAVIHVVPFPSSLRTKLN